MPETLDTLAHSFDFIEDVRSDLVFSGSIRLDPKRHVVELKPDVNGDFPTTGDHYVIGPLYQPKAVRQWVGFQAMIDHVIEITQITGDGFRLHDGTNQYWWNGAAWTINTANWNTEAEVAVNIGSFPVTTRKLRVVIRLATTDRLVTPRLRWVKVAWNGRINSYLEDIIYRSLVPSLRGIRLAIDFAFKVQFPGGTSVPLGPAMDSASLPFNVVDVESVFNQASDPDHYTNLLVSYNPSTRTLTLSSPVPVGTHAFCRLLVEPEVAVETTDQDYVEVEKTPNIVLSDISEVASSPLSQDEGVVNKSTGAALRIPAPYRFDIRFTMIASSPGGVAQMRMISAIVGYMENNPLLRSIATDEKYRIWMQSEFSITTRPAMNGLNSSQATVLIKDVLSFHKPATSEVAVRTVTIVAENSHSTAFDSGFDSGFR